MDSLNLQRVGESGESHVAGTRPFSWGLAHLRGQWDITEDAPPVYESSYTAVGRSLVDDFTRMGKATLGIASDVDADIKYDAIAQVVPATVQIKVAGKNKQHWAGSGFILDREDAAKLLPGGEFPPDAYFISTNNHVAAGAKTIDVITADGKRKFRAEVVRGKGGAELLDDVADTALLMVRSPEPLPTAKIDDPKWLEQGDTVLTAGYPLALPNVSVTKGIVSQPAQVTGEALLAIQSDAAINPGNSGGPLFTLDGRVVGMNTYTIRNANDMSFAQPITGQFAVLGKIWSEGEIIRGDLGVDIKALKPSRRGESGLPPDAPAAIISGVRPGSEMARQGIKEGDVISKIDVLRDGKVFKIIETDVMYDFQRTFVMNQIYRLSPGEKVRAKIYRRGEDGNYKGDTVDILVARYSPPQEALSVSWGIKFERDITGDLLLTEVLYGSPAEEAGLEGGGNWVVRGIWSRDVAGSEPLPVRSAADMLEYLRAMDEGQTTEVLLYLEDASSPNKRKRVILRRGLNDGAFARAGDMLINGAGRMVSYRLLHK